MPSARTVRIRRIAAPSLLLRAQLGSANKTSPALPAQLGRLVCVRGRPLTAFCLGAVQSSIVRWSWEAALLVWASHRPQGSPSPSPHPDLISSRLFFAALSGPPAHPFPSPPCSRSPSLISPACKSGQATPLCFRFSRWSSVAVPLDGYAFLVPLPGSHPQLPLASLPTAATPLTPPSAHRCPAAQSTPHSQSPART